MMTSKTASVLSMVAVAGLATSAYARPDFPEVEPNETKAQALTNGASTLVAGDSVSGVTTGALTTAGLTSLDTFLIKTAALAPGIYRHRLTLTTTGTVGHTGTVRGLNQVAGVAGVTDTAVQTSSTATTPARMNQWYGFGKQEQVYYRVTGVAATTANYIATLTTDVITPTNAGSFAGPLISITTVGQTTTDTDFWVYDSSFNAIPGYGNDDESILGGGTGATLQSLLRRNYAPGTYYIAMANFQTANNQTAAIDDDFRTGTLLDFPDAVANSSTTANADVDFTITDSAGTTPITAIRAGAFDVVWFSFTVTGAGPATGACCLTGNTCLVTDSITCTNILGGAYAGDATTCLAGCPAGACCFPNGTCTDINQFSCVAQAGTWNAGQVCASTACPQPGACCLADGTCIIMTPAQCTSASISGVFAGPGVSCVAAACAQPLYKNGELQTGTVTGNGTVAPFGNEWSEVADDGTTSCSNTSAGATVTPSGTTGAFRCADDLVVTAASGWNIDSLYFYGYVTGSTTTTTPFTGANLRIWNGKPGEATSTVIFGDTTTNRLVAGGSKYSGLFRTFNTTTPPPGTATTVTRPVYRNEIAVGTTLPAGTYWIDVQLTGPATAFAPNNTIPDVRSTPGANSIQFTTTPAWVALLDAGNPAACADLPLDFPFVIKGTVAPTTCYANCDNSTIAPCLNVIDFQCFINEYAAASSYANCDLSTVPPILNVIDFQCYLNAFAASCTNPCAAH